MPDLNFISGLLAFLAVFFGETFGCMFGGGGFFIQPALLALGIPAKIAVANDIAAAAFSSAGFLLTTKNNTKEVRKNVLFIAPTLVIGAFVGGNVLKIIPDDLVKILVLVICSVGFIYILTHFRRKKDIEISPVAAGPVQHWKIALLLCGLLLGFYDGLSGAGGGIMTIAALSLIMRGGMKTIISMANWVGAVSLSTAAVTFFFLGLLDFSLLSVMVPAAVLAGMSAAKISDALPEKWLRLIYAVVLSCLLVYLIADLLRDYGFL